MKTAVSIPDHVFDAAERLAEKLGISRSELYQRALECVGSGIGAVQSGERKSAFYLLKSELLLKKLKGEKKHFSTTAEEDARSAVRYDPLNKRAYEVLFNMYAREYDRRGSDKNLLARKIRALFAGIEEAKSKAAGDAARARLEAIESEFSRFSNY